MHRLCMRTNRAGGLVRWAASVAMLTGIANLGLAQSPVAPPALPLPDIPVLPSPVVVVPGVRPANTNPVSGTSGVRADPFEGLPGMPDATFPVIQPSPETAVVPGPIGSTVPVADSKGPPEAVLVPGVPAPPPPASDKSWEMVWNNGLFFQTQNKDFTFHSGALLQYDGAWYSGGTAVQRPANARGVGGTDRFHDGTNLRRGRFYFEGTIYQNIDYKFEMEFFNGIGFSPTGTQGNVVASSLVNSPGPTDAWITVKDVPLLGNIRVGSQKEWFSLEHLEGYRFLQFMERSYLFDFTQLSAFNNGFTPGISVFRTWMDDRVFSAIGFYKNESDLVGFGVGDGQYAVTGRLAFLPVWDPENQRFWHVGGAMSHRDPVDDQVQVRVRDNIRNAPFPLLNLLLNTGQIPTRSQNLFNVETAFVNGPLTLQAEYTANVLNGVSPTREPGSPNLGTHVFHGAYANVMYFLTGESRTWNTKMFFYNRVVPKKNFAFAKDGCGIDGWGAWEIGARYTYLCVTDKTIAAGQLNAATLGLNWHLNPNCRFQFNYDYTYRNHNEDPTARGAIHAFGSRFSLDF